MSHAFGSLDELGDGYGFRKIRAALGVEAFGVNAIVYPANYEGPEHYHDTQDELYFVHRGRSASRSTARRASSARAGCSTQCSTTPRRISNAGDEDAIVFIVGGKGGYVERDGHLVDPEADLPRRQGLG